MNETPCTKDCVLYNHPFCFINSNAPKSKRKHRTICDAPTPGSCGWEDDVKFNDEHYHPKKEKKQKRTMPRIVVGKKRIPHPQKETSSHHNTRSKPIMQLTLDGRHVRSYQSSGEAARALGNAHSRYIRQSAHNDKTAYGYKWKFITPEQQ